MIATNVQVIAIANFTEIHINLSRNTVRIGLVTTLAVNLPIEAAAIVDNLSEKCDPIAGISVYLW